MADIKISALPGASTLTGAETIPLVQGGTTKKVTSDQFLIKDASGNVGVGTASPTHRIDAVTDGGTCYARTSNGTITSFSGVAASVGGAVYGTGTNHPVVFLSNGTERARIDSAGNLGLGVAPSAWWGFSAIEQNGGSVFANATQFGLAQNAYVGGAGWVYKNTGAASFSIQMDGSHSWFTAPSGTAGNPISFTQAMTLGASGNLLVGTTSTDYSTHGLKYRADLGTLLVTSTDSEAFFAHRIGSTGTLVNLYCTGAAVGSISSNGTTVAYNTSSDARLKENIAAADNGSALIDSLQVRKFDWKSDGSHQRFGFVAQELDAVYPEAVSKPADPDEMMGVDYSKLVPLLVQEIQSLRARVAALETV